MPNMKNYGLSEIHVLYDDSLLVRDTRYSRDLNYSKISNNKLQKMAGKTKVNPSIPVCFDIEGWNLLKYTKASIPKYINLINEFKSRNFRSKLGFYGVLPYADSYLYNSSSSVSKNIWKNLNNSSSIGQIGAHVDIAYPSCYTRSKDLKQWKSAVLKQVSKIKEIRSDIPIYAFIWPQFYSHSNQKLNGTFIDYTTWLSELEFLYQNCDGIVIWGPPFDLKTRKPIQWNGNLPWWRATTDFISSHNLK